MTKPTILTLVPHYLPGFRAGGPLRSIANLVDHLGDEFAFRIVTRDRDVGDTGPYPNVSVDAWNVLGPAQVFYASPGTVRARHLIALLRATPHDMLYLNSFFDPAFTFVPLVARRLALIPRRPLVLAPRGEFARSALALKAWKKGPYRTLARLTGLHGDATWMASSPHEAADIARAIGAATIVTASDLPGAGPGAIRVDRAQAPGGGTLKIVFLSRIDPMKNLDVALAILSQVSVPVALTIVGPVSDAAYWARCQGLIERLPANVTCTYRGEMVPADVPGFLAGQDLLLLPTRGENFGHVILEALSAGTPALISDRTPWRSSPGDGCTALALENEAAFVAAIERHAGFTGNEREAARIDASDHARAFVRDGGHVEANRSLFRNALQPSRQTVLRT